MGALRRWYTRLVLALLAKVPAMAFEPPPPCVNQHAPDCVDWPFWLFDLAMIYALMTWIAWLWRADAASRPAPAVGPLTPEKQAPFVAAQPAPAVAGGRHYRYTFRSDTKGG